ncbi:MAG: hypothetical protein ACFCGT_28160 [Sandaracinaceae bacterium]
MWCFAALAGAGLTLLLGLDAVVAAGASWGPTLAAALAVLTSVGLAVTAHGGLTLLPHAVAFGAAGALVYEAVRPTLPLVAAGLLLAAVFGTRAMRARSFPEVGLHVAAAFVSGVAAAGVILAHQGAERLTFLVAVVVAGLLSSVPWLVPADRPRPFALRRAASRLRAPLRFALLRAAASEQRIQDLEPPIPRPVRRRVDAETRELLRLAEDLADGGAPASRGARIRALARELSRLGRLAGTQRELVEDLDRTGRPLAGASADLEVEVAALAEMVAEGSEARRS